MSILCGDTVCLVYVCGCHLSVMVHVYIVCVMANVCVHV